MKRRDNETQPNETKRLAVKQLGAKQLAIPIALMCALVIAGVAVVLLLSRAERKTVNESVYQYVFKEQERYAEGISMKKTKDVLLIDNGYQQYETNGLPFYYDNSKSLILTDSFLYLNRSGNIGGRVDYYTEITDTGSGYALSDPSGVVLDGGMLHNGEDVYIFLETTTITYNGKSVEIPGFSYVECFRGQSILISSYGWSESLYEELDGDAVAVAEMDNGIKVDLVSDIYYSPNGTKHLLFTTPEVFEQVR